MNWISPIWEIFVNVIEAGLFLYLLIHQLGYKKEKKPYIIGGIIIRILWISFLNFTIYSSTLCLLLLLFYDIIYTSFLFSGSAWEKLFWGCSYIIIAMFADNITFWAADTFTNYRLAELLVAGKIRIMMSCIYLLICFLAVCTLAHWKKKDSFLPRHFRFVLALLVCSGIIVCDQLLSVIIYTDFSQKYPHVVSRLEFISYIIFLILLGFIILIEYLAVVAKQKENFREAAAISELRKEHYETMSTTVSALRGWKHDYQNHLQVILNLAKSGKADLIEEYIADLEANINSTVPLISTDNEILDALLSTKLLECKKYAIQFSHEIYLISDFKYDDILFTSLIGNLLDNAIDACRSMKKESDRYIRLSIRPYQEMLYINIENSTTNTYAYHFDGSLKSSKKGYGHGIGLKRIQEIVSNANGFCHIYPEEHKFTVTIMLPLPS